VNSCQLQTLGGVFGLMVLCHCKRGEEQSLQRQGKYSASWRLRHNCGAGKSGNQLPRSATKFWSTVSTACSKRPSWSRPVSSRHDCRDSTADGTTVMMTARSTASGTGSVRAFLARPRGRSMQPRLPSTVPCHPRSKSPSRDLPAPEAIALTSIKLAANV
jgi:hypothetical protein